MKKIFIGFSKPNHFAVGSLLIRLIEGTDFSHTFILINGSVFQESMPEINVIDYVDFQKKNKIVDLHTICVSDEKLDEIISFCVDSLTAKVPYGRYQLVGMGAVRLLNRLGFRFKNPFADGQKTMVCSEFVGYILKILGISVPMDQLEVEGPKLIHKIVKKSADSTCHDQFIENTQGVNNNE